MKKTKTAPKTTKAKVETKAKKASPSTSKMTQTKMEVARVSESKVKLAGKKSAKIEIMAIEVAATATDEEDEDLDLASTETSKSSSRLAHEAIASEVPTGSIKNFRQHPDIENFYRFIFENNLRSEALEIIDGMISQRATKKTVKAAKNKAH